jgi:hypothetical protein
MTSALVLAAVLLAADPTGTPPTEAGAAGDAARDRVEAFLGTIDTRLPPAVWKGLGPEAAPVLEALARDEARMPSARARAVSALAALDPAEGERLARDLVEAASAPPTVRQAAVRALGHLLSPAALVSAIGPVLRSGEGLGLRAAAAETLARRAPALACPDVLDQAGREAAPDRPALERAVALCAGR